jgi:tetratricopeptide (TPR) repeat protein
MKSNSLVTVWEENVVIPTYGIGKPEKNPIFLENRVYQGSSGAVYPYPVIEKILDVKKDKTYHAVYLENQYLKIMILPELGGRVQMAFDKIKQRHFVYYNQVIKPALVGLTGPWISGGIEFNWPQHHRPSTFDPIDFTIEEHEDGGKTVWVNEVERISRTKGMAGFRLHPDKAYLEINVKLHNRTPFPQTFLWWANPAVKVNDDYQTVFPPDVHAVYDHGKRDVSEFPMAKGTYYKVDYSAGVDISRYKNIPVPTSYMAIKSKYDFMGGYEHDSKGGLLHVADHHVSPGKKQWTWGNGEFGHAWDRNLTDEDGPYIELMTGVFTDNQPDFSWMQPNEERTFTQYFMPYSELGVVKNATKNAMVNLEVEGQSIHIKLFATAFYPDAKVLLLHKGKEILSETLTISPERFFSKSILLDENPEPKDLAIRLVTSKGKLLVGYQPETTSEKVVPKPAEPAKYPKDISSIEQLFLTGLHLEQYRHATFKATDYYKEALRREPTDARNNNALGLWYLKRGKFSDAEPYFKTAIRTLTERNPNPYDGEAYFNLGTCLVHLERYDEAFDAYYKSTWSAGWQDVAYLNLARLSMRKQNFEEALEFIEKSLTRNSNSHTARHLKAVALRKLKGYDEALSWTKESLALDKFNYGCLYEDYLLLKNVSNQVAIAKLKNLQKIIRGCVHNYIEYAFDYAAMGLYEDASDFLQLSFSSKEDVYPMVYYYLGYFELRTGDDKKAILFYKKASEAKSDYCFPNRIEDVRILQSAIALNPKDSKAPYYLGNFWYANKQYSDAILCWENSSLLDNKFPTAFRNLALAYHNKQNNHQKAIRALETAFNLDMTDARVLMELDQLYKKLNKPHIERLALLERYLELVESRDDLYLERVTLCNHTEQYEKAMQLLAARIFHPWEGGEGKVVGQYLICHIELAKKALWQGQYAKALSLLEAAEVYPHNLGEGKLYGAQENDIFYLKGCCFEALGMPDRASEFFTKSTMGLCEPTQAIYYNDQHPDKIFYQGLAWKKLGQHEKAEAIFKRLISFGKEHMDDNIQIDYFAVSLPDLLVFDQDLNQRNRIHCHFLIGLGYLGLNNGKQEEAGRHFNVVLENDINHLAAAAHKKMIEHSVPID